MIKRSTVNILLINLNVSNVIIYSGTGIMGYFRIFVFLGNEVQKLRA